MEDEGREGTVCTGRPTLPSTRDPLPSSKPQPNSAQGGDGESASAALVCAAENGNMEEVQRLLRCNASIDAADSRVTPSGAPTGLTPLMWAVRMGHARVAHFLLAHGAAVDAKDAIGRQPLRHAATSSSIDGLRLLVEYKAAVDARDAKGWSALGRAACRGHEPAVATLLAAGATPASTMVARARAGGHFPIATLLEAALRRRNKNLLFQVTDCTEPGWLERRAKGKGVDKRTLENVNLALALRAGRGGGGAQARGGSDLCASRLDAASGQGV